jgi:cytochrome c553
VILILAAAAALAVPPPGATACSGCHGAPGSALPSLRGRSEAEIVAAMTAFRTGARPATLMDRIAKGFTEDETRAIAAWIGSRK